MMTINSDFTDKANVYFVGECEEREPHGRCCIIGNHECFNPIV